MTRPRIYLNADHDPADFAICPNGHATRQFELPAGKITGDRGDWIFAYVCDACAESDVAEGGELDDAPIIQVPCLERLSELRMSAHLLSTTTH